MKVYELNLNTEYFDSVASGSKPFEIIKNENGYKVGDVLALSRYDKKLKKYTDGSWRDPWLSDDLHEAETIFKRITYVSDYEQKDGYVVLGLGKYIY